MSGGGRLCRIESMNTAKKQVVAIRANEAGRGSRRRGAPILSVRSSRETILDWLQWNDPNGAYTDERAKIEDFEPMTDNEAWQMLDETLTENGW